MHNDSVESKNISAIRNNRISNMGCSPFYEAGWVNFATRLFMRLIIVPIFTNNKINKLFD